MDSRIQARLHRRLAWVKSSRGPVSDRHRSRPELFVFLEERDELAPGSFGQPVGAAHVQRLEGPAASPGRSVSVWTVAPLSSTSEKQRDDLDGAASLLPGRTAVLHLALCCFEQWCCDETSPKPPLSRILEGGVGCGTVSPRPRSHCGSRGGGPCCCWRSPVIQTSTSEQVPGLGGCRGQLGGVTESLKKAQSRERWAPDLP